MKKINWHLLIISILVPNIIGFVIGLLTSSNSNYTDFIQPDFAPPSWVFPVVWTVLYTLMGISYYLIFISHNPNRPNALNIYKLQLIVNYFWSIIFFVLNLKLLAFFWIILLIILVTIMIIRFYNINKTSAYIQIPYLIWLIFASILNLSIYFLN